MSRINELETILLKPAGQIVRAALPDKQWAALVNEYVTLRTGTDGKVRGRYFDIPQDGKSKKKGKYFDIPKADDKPAAG